MKLYDLAIGKGTVLALAVAIGSLAAIQREPPGPEEPRGRVVVTETETTILDVVEFLPQTKILRPRSLPTLDAVAATLVGNPTITLVEVQSHAPELGLSQVRAELVRDYLVARGVAPGRLVAQGYGDTQPIDRAAPVKNERMSFLILERAPEPDAPAP